MTTKDYKVFRNMVGNRKIIPGHVEKLAEAIEKKNLLEYFPILVNENMEVIDGQHRLVADAKLDYPVHYEIVDGLKLEDVMSINTHSRVWSTPDFIDTYITLGNDDYETLKEFMYIYHMAPSVAASLLYGFNSASPGGIGQLLREGKFSVRTPEFAYMIADNLNQLRKYTEFPVNGDRTLIRALILLNNNLTFDLGRFIAKLRLSGDKFERRNTVNQYLLEVEELYNFNAKNKVELYASSQL